MENTTKQPVKSYLLAYLALIISMVVMTAMIKWLRTDSTSEDKLRIEQLERKVENQDREIRNLERQIEVITYKEF
jgi:choline-glycine betaine transporter